MEKTLLKKSDFLKKKYKFFINRALIYFSFLCIPIWIQKSLDMALIFQSIILLMYMMFMMGQSYLLGKEIDHRLKIYYRANSSMERIVYRVILGSIVMLFLFNFFALFSVGIKTVLFWLFFSALGLFYSWPTRGKIIEETMMGQFGEIKFLDSFEKTILILSSLTFFISLPELPLFQNIEALKIYFDPQMEVSNVYWNYLSTLYVPFIKFPKLYNLIWSFHFYFVGMGTFLLVFYCFLRYFFSRRLAMLGVFSVLSTWSFSRVLSDDYFATISTTLPLVWIWAHMWSTRSNTYRSGLFTGLVTAYLTMINPLNFLLFPAGLIATYKVFLSNKTAWYRKQWVKYNLLGLFVGLAVVFSQTESLNFSVLNGGYFVDTLLDLIYRKAFYIISPIGFILISIYSLNKSGLIFTYVNFDKSKVLEALSGIAVFIILGCLVNPSLVSGFNLIWMLSFFALVPLEWIFQSISRLRSKRNMIYAMYILVCLLDSHLENRFRIIGKLFLEIESFKYFIEL